MIFIQSGFSEDMIDNFLDRRIFNQQIDHGQIRQQTFSHIGGLRFRHTKCYQAVKAGKHFAISAQFPNVNVLGISWGYVILSRPHKDGKNNG